MAGVPAGYDSSESEEDEIVFADDALPYSDSDFRAPAPEPCVPDPVTRRSFDSATGRPLEDLRMAAAQGNLQTVQRFIKEGLKPDAPLKGHWTPLLYACAAGAADVVTFLLEHGADPNSRHDGTTALMAACGSRRDSEERVLACVESLLQHGARCNGHDRQGVSPLMLCAREGYSRVLQRLLDGGADPDAHDARGWTALCWAAHEGQGRAARLLLRLTPDPAKLVTLAGQMPSDLALARGHDTLADVLRNYESKGDPGSKEVRDAPSARWCEAVSGDVELFLGSLDLCHLVPVFAEHRIDFAQLLAIEDAETLIQMGIENSEEREKILEGVRAARKFQVPRSSRQRTAGAGQVASFLHALDLSSLEPLFRKITWDQLLLADDRALRQAGVTQVGVRRKILDGVRKVHLSPWQKTSLRDLRQLKTITCPDAVSLVSNVGAHLRYVALSVRFLRQQLVRDPNILTLGRDLCSVKHLDAEGRTAHERARAVADELDALLKHLAQVSDRPEYLPHWPPRPETKKPRERAKFKMAIATVTAALAAAVAIWCGRTHRTPV